MANHSFTLEHQDFQVPGRERPSAGQAYGPRANYGYIKIEQAELASQALPIDA